MKEYEYIFKYETVKAEPNFGRYFSTGNLYFYARIHEEGVMSRIIDVTEKYSKKLPYLHGVISDCYMNANTKFLMKNNIAEPTGETVVIDGETCCIFKFNEKVLKSINPKMFEIYYKNFD